MKIIFTCLLFITSICFAEVPKKIELIVPYGPGGASDQAARHFQTWLASKNYVVSVVNKAGAQGTIAMQDLAMSPKDGSVISFTAAGVIVIAEQRAGKKLVEPLTVTGTTVHAIVSYPTGKYNSYSLFEQGLKTGADDLMFGWFAVGNLSILNQIQKNVKSTKDITRVPFKTSADTAHNIMNNSIPIGMIPMAVAKPLIDSNKLKLVIAVAPKEYQLPKEFPSIIQKFPNWKHQDGFIAALPYGVDERIEQSWMILLKEYFEQKETHRFYDDIYLAKAPFGKKHVLELINNAEESIKKLDVQIK